MTRPVVHITTGLPASGKSTFAKSLGIVRFNLDDMRTMQGFGFNNPSVWTRTKEEAVKSALIKGVIATVDAGLDVVVDNTHLTPKFPRAIRDKLHGKAHFEVHSFLDVPIDVCIERDKQREQSVGEDVIRKLAKSLKAASKNGWVLDNDWMNLWPVTGRHAMDPRNPSAIVIDLDGTLALHAHRGPYDTSKLETDVVNKAVHNTMLRYQASFSKIILLSGRDAGECYDSTCRWLNSHNIGYDHLFMRPEGDKRPDYVVKYELFKTYVEPNFWVSLCLDDRDQCVALWRQLGLSTFQANYGDF